MPGSVYASVWPDREGGMFSVVLDYTIEGYSDPETGEYFGDTSWNYWISDLDSGESGGNGGFAGEGDTISVEFWLGEHTTLNRWGISFNAQNGFSGVSVALDLTVQSAADASDGLAIDGGAGIDVIFAGAGDDTLDGQAGNDHLDAGPGADALAGGDGADTLDGGAGIDTLAGGAGNDSYRVDDPDDAITELAGGGHDGVLASASFTLAPQLEWLALAGLGALDATGNALANTLDGNAGANRLRGGSGDDLLRGNSGEDLLLGGRGEDTLEGGAQLDTLRGGLGDDIYRIDTGGDLVEERAGEGFDVVEGTGFEVYELPAEVEAFLTRSLPGQVLAIRVDGNALDNAIAGGAGNDTLLGAAGDDQLSGGDGDDLLLGDAGADTLSGGLGRDALSYAQSVAAVVVRLDTGTGSGGDAEGDDYASIEQVTGSAQADQLTGDASANRLAGGAGADTLDGGAGDDTLLGGAQGDALQGGAGRDMLSYAGSTAGAVTIDLALQQVSGGDAAGDAVAGFEHATGSARGDTLTGSAQGNRLLGGAGDDLLAGGAGSDTLTGGRGADTLQGGDGADVLSYAGSAGSVTVSLTAGAGDLQSATGGDADGDVVSGFRDAIGGNGDDTLSGNVAANRLSGGAGADTLTGRAGNDTLTGGPGADTLQGGLGIDTVSYAGARLSVAISLASGTANSGEAAGDRISGFENLIGGFASDYLAGDDAGNRIAGGAGSDVIDGRLGDDTLSGGADGDAFYLFDAIGHDTLTDFGGTDVLVPGLGEDFDSFEEIMAVASAAGAGGEHTLFDFGALGSLLVLDVAVGSFTEDSFLF